MTRKEIIDKLHILRAEIPILRELHPKSNEDKFTRWKELVAFYVLAALDNNEKSPIYLRLENYLSEGPKNVPAFRRHYLTPNELNGVEPIIESLISSLEDKNEIKLNNKDVLPPADKHVDILNCIFLNFHRFAQQLRARQNNSAPIYIEDEYALQDFVHAILRLHFDKVDNEFPLPPYCGAASRIDFYLKEERIGIEVKYASKELTANKLRKQLIEDKEQYVKSGVFNEIVFFIYNPLGALCKPVVFIDLEEKVNDCTVRVIVSPTVAHHTTKV